ncbi:Com family DNA-binding transcriptional regulator [uncultured Methylophaga sp.]|uniref:Com family DNA-binding transcriptional regulator n=1 Tax=uncultured Methylophaga sp. TaxID=285271 RepID=UPI00263822DA|nr:Com family DNA-binding transcriptional regulator [uncultured Methylophaga sp.]
MIEVRCGGCGRLLAKAEYVQIEIKCPRCKTLNNLKATEPLNQAPTSANAEEENHGQTHHSLDGR